MIKCRFLLFYISFFSLTSVAQNAKQSSKDSVYYQTIQEKNESRWKYLLKEDSSRSIEITSLKSSISFIKEDINDLKKPNTDNSKFVLPLISLLFGFLFTIGWNVLRDRYKDRRIEEKAINRWKAGLSILTGGISNQIKYNEEVIQKLSENKVESIFPQYDLSLRGDVFASMDKGILFHYLEKKDILRAADRNNGIHSIIGSTSDIYSKLDLLRANYQNKITSQFDKITSSAQVLQKEIWKLVTSYNDDPGKNLDHQGTINEIINAFQNNLVSLNEGSDPFGLVDSTFRPIHRSAQIFRGKYEINGLLDSCMGAIHSITSIKAERDYYIGNLLVVNAVLKENSASVPIVLKYLE